MATTITRADVERMFCGVRPDDIRRDEVLTLLDRAETAERGCQSLRDELEQARAALARANEANARLVEAARKTYALLDSVDQGLSGLFNALTAAKGDG